MSNLLFKLHPSYWLGAVRAVLMLMIALHVVALTDVQTGSILAVVSAVTAIALALSVRPFAWPLITGLVQAVLALILGFGVALDQAQQGAILTVVAVVLSFVDHKQVTPETKLPALA